MTEMKKVQTEITVPEWKEMSLAAKKLGVTRKFLMRLALYHYMTTTMPEDLL